MGFYNVFLPSDRSTFDRYFSRNPIKAKDPSPKRDRRRVVCDSERLLLVISEVGCGVWSLEWLVEL